MDDMENEDIKYVVITTDKMVIFGSRELYNKYKDLVEEIDKNDIWLKLEKKDNKWRLFAKIKVYLSDSPRPERVILFVESNRWISGEDFEKIINEIVDKCDKIESLISASESEPTPNNISFDNIKNKVYIKYKKVPHFRVLKNILNNYFNKNIEVSPKASDNLNESFNIKSNNKNKLKNLSCMYSIFKNKRILLIFLIVVIIILTIFSITYIMTLKNSEVVYEIDYKNKKIMPGLYNNSSTFIGFNNSNLVIKYDDYIKTSILVDNNSHVNVLQSICLNNSNISLSYKYYKNSLILTYTITKKKVFSLLDYDIIPSNIKEYTISKIISFKIQNIAPINTIISIKSDNTSLYGNINLSKNVSKILTNKTNMAIK